jgi:dolichol-phosphate mannosyltransferase
MKEPYVSIVIPSYNEHDNIEPSITAIREEMMREKQAFEIIVVDDNSPDKTGDVVRKLSAKWPEVHLINNLKRNGIGYALSLGYTAARGEVIVSTDADNSVAPAYITNGLEKIAEGFDFVVGCRHCKEGYYEAKEEWYNFVRIPVSKAGNAFTRAITGIPVNDFSLNFRLFKKKFWAPEQCKSTGNAFMLEVVVEAAARGARVAQIPVKFLERKSGATKTRLGKEALKFFKRLLQLKFVEKKP